MKLPPGCLARALSLAVLISFAIAANARATSAPVQGSFPSEVLSAFSEGLLAPAPRPGAGTETPSSSLSPEVTSLTQGQWKIPVILVSFTDQPEVYEPGLFAPLLFDTTGSNPDGSMAEYFRTVSGGALGVSGDVYGWYQMEHDLNYYASNSYGIRRTGSPNNVTGLVQHAAIACDDDIDFNQYDRDKDGEVDIVFIVHSGVGAEATPGTKTNLWSLTSSMDGGWRGVIPYVTNDLIPGTINQFVRINRFAILPEYSSVKAGDLTEIGTYCHEFGHALGLPDLYDASSLGGGANLGPANWCLMSTGSFGGDSRSPNRPTRPCAWTLMDAGWASVQNITSSGPATFLPVDETATLYRLWWQGEANSEYFLMENRLRRGYDADLPGEGLLIYRIEDEVIAASRSANRVNSGLVPGVRLEEADGRYDLMSSSNRADASDPFPGSTDMQQISDDTQPSARTYSGRHTNIAMTQIERVDDRINAWVQVTPTGWSETRDTAIPGVMRIGSGRFLTTWNSDLHFIYHDDADAGNIYAVQQAFDILWSSPQLVSASPASSDASWSLGFGSRLAATWTDRRDGQINIFYRRWLPTPTEERAATFNESFSFRPGAVWLNNGELGLFWLDTNLGRSQLFFKQFSEGEERSALESLLSGDILAEEIIEYDYDISGRGDLFALMTARGPEVDEIYWLYKLVGESWTTPQRVSTLDGFPSGSPDLSVQSDGFVRLVWRDSGPTRSLIQTRLFNPNSKDFVAAESPLFVSPLSLGQIQFVSGPGNASAVLARANEAPADRVLAAHVHSDGKWDYGLGWISEGEDAGGAKIGAYVDEVGTLTAVWTSRLDGISRILTRRRLSTQMSLVDVPARPGPGFGTSSVRAFPNPAVGKVRFAWESEDRDARLAIYAPSGRRVIRLSARQSQTAWRGRDDRGRALPPSVYFYRLEDAHGKPLSAVGKLVWIP